jgi:hypothetical protein
MDMNASRTSLSLDGRLLPEVKQPGPPDGN